MSYHRVYINREDFERGRATPESSNPKIDSPEAKAQIEAARAAAKAILDSGVMGTRECFVTIHGHANPGNEPVVGKSLDRLQVTITQEKPEEWVGAP